MSTIEQRAFRDALGAFATGVTVVTARTEDGRDVGVTANSFNSVSLDPPLVLWSLHKTSSSADAFRLGEHFAVHILAADQQHISNRFAGKGEDRFAGLEADRGLGEVALLPGCVVRFQCRLAHRYDGGDHDILVGEVVEFSRAEGEPLVYHGGRYAAVRAVPGSSDFDEPGSLLALVSRAYHRLFATARQALAERKLSEEAFYVLRILGRNGPSEFAELARLIGYSGRSLEAGTVDDLMGRDMVIREGDLLALTDNGRDTMVDVAALRLSAEEDALEGFAPSETQEIKALLDRLFRASS